MSSRAAARAIFFDLDGTLTDPKPGIVRSIQHALETLERPVPTEDELLWCIGPPLKNSFLQLLKDETLADQAVSIYRERFGEVGLYENRVYEGITGVLETLRGHGLRIHVATSKPHVYANRILQHFGLAGYFDLVFGSELDGTRTDKSELLAFALKQTNLNGSAAVMVGDRSHDIVGAVNNGLASVGVLYGYGSQHELLEAGADVLVEQVDGLAQPLLTDLL